MNAINFTQPNHRNNWTGTTPPSEWYGLYTAALLESDRNKAIRRIERAQVAIHDRRSELDQADAINPREAQDLSKAATCLGIMLRNVGTESERLLWD